MEKIKLEDQERSRIRWSSTKRGFVPRVEFQPRWSRGGARPVRPVRGRAAVTRQEAERTLNALATRYVNPIHELQLVEVDALGNVQRVEVVENAA